ncbi:UNC93-like protein [Anticarsia gemmatalis]|uniref:UNC93-like protein n=1 Tax=Anticarsia gemmatalis TaxID=129554 RepID=UPI003F76E31D
MTQIKVLEGALKPKETWRIWKNVTVVTIAFMFQFIAYNGAANLQSSINSEAGLGTGALASVYAGVIFSNIFLPSIVIKWLGTKWTVCLAVITYMPYIAAQLYPRFYTLIPAAIIVGLGAGPLWVGMSTYLAQASEAHSSISKQPAGTILLRFLGFFFMLFQMNQIWGNLISSLVLSSGNNTAAVSSVNVSMIPQLCGRNFIASQHAKDVLPDQPPEKIQMIAGIYLACMASAAVIVAIGLDSMKKYESCRKSASSEITGAALLARTARQLCNPNQSLLLVINIFIGQHEAFFSADFTASFVSCVVGTGTVGYVMMTYGLANAISSFVTSYMGKVVGRMPVMILGFIVHGALLVTMLTWIPGPDDQYIIYIFAVLWGLCNSIWTVQINAYYGVLFRGSEEASFSNYRLWEATGFIFSYIISSYIKTSVKVYLLLLTMTVGIIGYLMVEYRTRNMGDAEKEKETSVEKTEDVKC